MAAEAVHPTYRVIADKEEEDVAAEEHRGPPEQDTGRTDTPPQLPLHGNRQAPRRTQTRSMRLQRNPYIRMTAGLVPSPRLRATLGSSPGWSAARRG